MSDAYTRHLGTAGHAASGEQEEWWDSATRLDVLSDIAIWGALSALALLLVVACWRHREIYPQSVLRFGWLLGLLFLACGATHLAHAGSFWYPLLRLSGLLKFTTAVISWTTVIVLAFIMSRSPESPSLRRKDGLSDRRIEPLFASSEEVESGTVSQRLIHAERDSLETKIPSRIDQERQRIAEELHDGLGQKLSGLGLLAKSLERSLKAADSPFAGQALELSEGMPELLQELRGVVRDLLPAELQAGGLRGALTRLARETASRSAIACEFDCREPLEEPASDIALQLYRIAQEAVQNAVKHAHASRIVLRLGGDASEVKLQVEDNGRGVATGVGDGLGMKLLHQRASRLGAELSIQTEFGKGTNVCCIWRRESNPDRAVWASLENPDRG